MSFDNVRAKKNKKKAIYVERARLLFGNFIFAGESLPLVKYQANILIFPRICGVVMTHMTREDKIIGGLKASVHIKWPLTKLTRKKNSHIHQ